MQRSATWQWEKQSRSYGNYGNANQWTVNAGLVSLARESAQNTNDARPDQRKQAELVYTFIRLTGSDRDTFLEALEWHRLRSHLMAMGDASEGSVAAGQLKAGLTAFETSRSLILLRIADYGCRGLTGPEFPDDDVLPEDFGNFIKLCRLDLFSGKDKAAGGSFGLGKAVYWRFSRLQTVLFNSTLAAEDAVAGNRYNRVFGVNQGVMHRHEGSGFQGRGFLGRPDAKGDVASVWNDQQLVDSLHLTRGDARSGTTALLIGFYDPDQPELGTLPGASGHQQLMAFAKELQAGIEENFWPLITRGGLQVRIEVVDGERRSTTTVDAEDNYSELVGALRRFDQDDVDEHLTDPNSVVVRDVPIAVSKRRTGDGHDAFVHQAKLVVTLSDEQKDTLENRVCLLRRPEMVVQTIDRTFEGITYHAFLLAGAAIRPDDPSTEELRADDFLRFAEPPAHDRWIPGSGRGQTSQANLTAHYVAPWLPNLRKIETAVNRALFDLFGTPQATADQPPESLLRHLRFLRGEQGAGVGGGASRKPEAHLVRWEISGGRWDVSFEIRARNCPEGWIIRPVLAFVGLDGRREVVEWAAPLEIEAGAGAMKDQALHLPTANRGRFLKSTVRGLSTDALPIPPDEAAIEVVLRDSGPLLARSDEEAGP